MHLTGMWHDFLSQAGNQPGAQNGDVVITLLQPVGGVGEVTVPSVSVTIAAEAGNLIGLQVQLPDGRRLFALAANIAGIIDAPAEHAAEDKDEEKHASGRGRRSPVVVSGT